MKQIKLNILTLIIIISSIYSCDSFLDVNEDLDNPTADIVDANLILPAALNGSYSIKMDNQHDLGTILMNQWAGDVTNFSSINLDEYTFNVSPSFYEQIWNKNYIVTSKFYEILKKDNEKNSYFTAISKIMISHNMQYIVDLYGDAPYSQAFQRGDNLQPTYDDAFDIYKSLYIQLEEATELIDTVDSSVAIDPSESDVVFNGDMAKWKIFANTLKLKFLIRANSSSNADVQTWVNDKFNQLTSAVFLSSNVTINPGYTADTGKQNPFWNRFVKTDGTPTSSYSATVGSKYFIDLLISTGDSRISKYFTIANGSATYQGVEQGASDPEDPTIGLSFIGSGLLQSASQDGVLFSASESLFLQAEAALLGKISGNAQTLYENGVQKSFEYLNEDSFSYVSSLQPVSLESIINQKFIALHAFDGAELLIEHNRTGFPNPPFPLTVPSSVSHRPYRLMYPQSEVSGNSSNVIILSQNDIFTPTLFYQN